MIDTVQLRYPRPMPAASELLNLGFVSSDGRGDEYSPKWFNNPLKGSHEPRLTWTKRETADWLTAEVSLPKFVFGNNVREIQSNHIETALSDFGEYVQEAAQVDFDAMSARVGRVDYCRNWQLESDAQVRAYIKAFQHASLPRYSRRCENDSTVSLFNKSRVITLYSKGDELAQEKAIPELQRLADSVLRFETRFRSARSCSALAARFRVPNVAAELLNPQLWRSVMQADVSRVSLDKPVLTHSSLLRDLIQTYGASNGYKYYGFLCSRDELGDDFWKYDGLSQASYYRIQRELRENGFWLVSDAAELPPLPVASESLSVE